MRSLGYSIKILAGAAALALVAESSQAGTLPDLSLQSIGLRPAQHMVQKGSAAVKIEKVWWSRGRCSRPARHPGRRYYSEWGPAVAGFVDGATPGAGSPGPCWRRAWTYYGWYWVRVC
jgi:hypothetical protein